MCARERNPAKERMEYKNGKWELKEKAKNGDVVRLKIKLTIELKKRNKINNNSSSTNKTPIAKYETTKPFICDSTLEIRCSAYLFARSSQPHYVAFIHSAILRRGLREVGVVFGWGFLLLLLLLVVKVLQHSPNDFLLCTDFFVCLLLLPLI